MRKVRLGKTDLLVTKTSMGCLPVQRVSFDEAKKILLRAYDAGINFYDTAKSYTDSEEKIGYALSEVRHDIIIATKSPSTTKEGVLNDVKESLVKMKTDYVDILQLHNPRVLPDTEDENSAYAGLIEAKKQGLCRHIGITQHSIANAEEAVKGGKYETMQFPFSCLSDERETELTKLCLKEDVGFIGMKGLGGGLITKIRANFAYINQFENVVPIYGVQKMEELEEFIALENENPTFDDDMLKEIEEERATLGGDFCRGCGYCLPCPVGIAINNANRTSLLLRRAPTKNWLSDNWKAEMEKIDSCLECRQCVAKCPYNLDIPKLLKANLADYRQFYSEHKKD